MRTSFHHQPEAQHPNFPLSVSWQADYPISWTQSREHLLILSFSASDPKRIRQTGWSATFVRATRPAFPRLVSQFGHYVSLIIPISPDAPDRLEGERPHSEHSNDR